MSFLYALLGAVAFAGLLRNPLKRAPLVFYAIAVALVVLFLARNTVMLPAVIDRPLFLVMQKCLAAEALFVVVMFIGVFGENSRIRAWLMPIRAELSILACLLALGHIVAYLSTLGMRIVSNASGYSPNILASFCLSLLLVVLLIVLGVTSFKTLKKRMNAKTWKRIQWFAYPFFLLTWVHVLLYLLPSALQGGTAARMSVTVYSVVFVVYVVARSAVALKNRRAQSRVAVADR